MQKIDFLIERANDDLTQVYNIAERLDRFTKEMKQIYSSNQTGVKFVPKRDNYLEIQKHIADYGEITDYYHSFINDKYRFENKESVFVESEIQNAVDSVWGRFVFRGQDLLDESGALKNTPENATFSYSVFSNVSFSDYPVYYLLTFCYGISEISIPPYDVADVIGQNPANTVSNFTFDREDMLAQINLIPAGVYTALKLQICKEVDPDDGYDIEYISITDVDKYTYVYENIVQLVGLADEFASAEDWEVGDEIRIISSISKKSFRTTIQSIDTTLHQLKLTDTTPWEKTENEDGQYGEICMIQRLTGAARYFDLLHEDAIASNIDIAYPESLRRKRGV